MSPRPSLRPIALWGLSFLAAVTLRAEARPFYMATTPFFMSTTTFADWRWENMDDKDLVAIHVDDFYGVPWAAFLAGTPPPASWAARWARLAQDARAQGKPLYLSLSPLSGRRTLADEVNEAGDRVAGWAPVDSSGCYDFGSAAAPDYQQAYLRYCRYILDLVRPRYFSPALEISLTHGYCPSQRASFDAWYSGVYQALKEEDPRRVIFPTLQMEALYGTSEAALACTNGETLDQCFENRLVQELELPMDRVAFSMYPFGWLFAGETIADHDPFAVVQRHTGKRIWIAETGFQSAPVILQSNACTTLVPASLADETHQLAYMSWLLNEAQTRNFEAVNWWLNRDYLDGPSISVCPCAGDAGTCTIVSAWAGIGLEAVLKIFANMALRRFDGTTRPAWTLWKAALDRPLASASDVSSSEGRVYPNPFRPSRGPSGVVLSGLTAGGEVSVFDVGGRRVRRLRVDDDGTALWDGRDDAGAPASSGVYIAVGTEGSRRLKIVLQR